MESSFCSNFKGEGAVGSSLLALAPDRYLSDSQSAHPLEGGKYIWIPLTAARLISSSAVLSSEWIGTGTLNLCLLFLFKQAFTQHVSQVLAATCASCRPSIPRGTSVSVRRDCFFYLLVHAVVSAPLKWGQF